MGGDGGTLNNSRADHVRMRRDMLGHAAKESSGKEIARERASVSLCAASQQPLQKPIVVDRLGQLFRKDALIACMLAHTLAFSHIRSLSRDTALVNAELDSTNQLRCAVTRETVTERGKFCVGWTCGCIASASASAMLFRKQLKDIALLGESGSANGSSERPCPACGVFGSFVTLGLSGDEREKLRTEILLARTAAEASKRRKRNGSEDADRDCRKRRKYCKRPETVSTAERKFIKEGESSIEQGTTVHGNHNVGDKTPSGVHESIFITSAIPKTLTASKNGDNVK